MTKFRSRTRMTQVVAHAMLALALCQPAIGTARVGGASDKPAPRAAPAKQSAAPAGTSARAGGARDSGMTRSSVVSEARAQSPRNAPAALPKGTGGNGAGAGSQQQYYAGGQTSGQFQGQAPAGQKRGFTGGQVLGAAAAGAAAGYLLHSATTPNQPVAPAYGGQYGGQPPAYGNQGFSGTPQTTPAYAGDAPVAGNPSLAPMPAPMPQMTAPSSSSGFGTFLLLGLLGLGGFLLWLNRRTLASRANGFTQKSFTPPSTGLQSQMPQTDTVSETLKRDLLKQAPQAFRSLQDANNREDAQAMATVVDDTYLGTLTADFGHRETPSATRVHSVKVVNDRVLGFEAQDDRYVGSIHFLADVSEAGGPSEEIEEVWHFVRQLEGGSWKLAGIEQV